ncbi:MAG TPA: TetR-like C-terminal domain-containing protein [Acidimicrobiales bacterium]|nr:TetR-like C-terminal domain-containing protein [Acidimicrobiales bacterium]
MTALQPPRPAGVARVVAAARSVVERDGLAALTMQSVAAEMGIRAPSLYKHVAGRHAIEVELVADALGEAGAALHAALDEAAPPPAAIAALLDAYRRHALANPDMYRLATTGPLPRRELPAGLEDWAGAPFLAVTGDAHLARALWSFAHGMVILELDGRFPEASDLDATWAAGATTFARAHMDRRNG